MDCSQNNPEGKRVSLPLQNRSINKWPYLHLWTFPNLWPTNRQHTLRSLVNSVLTRLFVSHLTQSCALVRELCAKQCGSGRFISNLIRPEALSIRENQNLAFIRKLQSTSFIKNVWVSCKKKRERERERHPLSLSLLNGCVSVPAYIYTHREWKINCCLYASYYYNFAFIALNCSIASTSNYWPTIAKFENSKILASLYNFVLK